MLVVIKKDFKKLGHYTLDCLYFRNKDAAAFLITICLEKKNHKILAALKYKPLYNISRSEKWHKKNTSRGL
jgi:hypothetical protein